MTTILKTEDISAADRAEAVRDVIWSSVVRVEIDHHPDPSQIAAVGAISDVGRINVCTVRSNATTIRRTSRLAGDDLEPSLFVGLHIGGIRMVIQGGRQTVLGPGDFTIYDTTDPYVLINDHGINQHFFRIPKRDLVLPEGVAEKLTATRFDRDHPVIALTGKYFAELAGMQRTPVAPRVVAALGVPSIELLRAAISTRLTDRHLVGEALESTLELRIMAYLRDHLAENDLSAARIARQHNISQRTLYALFARSGISLADWLRTERLEACRRELAQPTAATATIASIAHRWGFADATHFSRVFKTAYGMSPRDWRRLRQRSLEPRVF